MQIDTVSVLESDAHSRSRSRVSRADSRVHEHRAHTSMTTVAVIFNVKTICTFRRRTKKPLLHLSQAFARKTGASSASETHSLSPVAHPLGSKVCLFLFETETP